MSLNASLFLALRYLRPRRSFVSVITLLAIVGPVLGVSVLIVVISVMSGFQRDIRSAIFDFQAHLRLLPAYGTNPDEPRAYIADPLPMVDTLREWGYRATPVVSGPALVQTRRVIKPLHIKGIDPETSAGIGAAQMLAGTHQITDEQCLVGVDLASLLNVDVGDKLIIHPTGKLQDRLQIGDDGTITENPESESAYLPEEVTIAGIFRVGAYDVDSGVVLVHIDKADTIFDLPWGSAESIQIWTDDPFDLQPLMDRIAADPAVFGGTYASTWQQENRQYLQVLATEKNVQFILQFLILIVASFSITATVITIVIQKTREIGVLKAMGANPVAILLLFLIYGSVVGGVGIAVGTGLGLFLIHIRNDFANWLSTTFHVEIFPQVYYQFERIPAEVVPADLAWIIGGAFAISVLAALLPTLYAAMLKPATALRTET